MMIDEMIQLLHASLPEPLTQLQEWLLRQTWDGKTYGDMAVQANYTEQYLRKTASDLWLKLSDFWGEPITKPNFRTFVESRNLTKGEQNLIENFCYSKPKPPDFPSGPVPIKSPFYILRPPIEELAFSEVTKPGCVIRIKAPRQMGKSSLMLRIVEEASSWGYLIVTIDLQQADRNTFTDPDKFLRWFSANVTRQLHLELKLDEYWIEEIGSKVSCTIYFEEYLLSQLQAPLVIILNEVNLIFEYLESSRSFFSLLRSWHEQAKQTKIWEKLRLVVTYSTELYISLNISQSPFNIGLPLKLPPFNLSQIQELACRHGLNWKNGKDAKQLMAVVGGHPYLVRLALYHVCRHQTPIKQLLHNITTEGGIYSHHLRQLLGILQEDPQLYAAFKQVIFATQTVQLQPITAYKLDSLGLVTLEETGCLPSCELYRLYFSMQLV